VKTGFAIRHREGHAFSRADHPLTLVLALAAEGRASQSQFSGVIPSEDRLYPKIAPAERRISPATKSAFARTLTPLILFLIACVPAFSQAMSQGIISTPANVRPPYLENVGIDQRLDAQVPADLAFLDDSGRAVKLGDYFGEKPLILTLVYYTCPMLCGETLAGLAGSLKAVKFDVGKEFDIVTVSFNPNETPEIAAAKKSDYVKRYGRPGAASGWHFLTGSAASINALTKAVGFKYQYDPKINQYAHATAIMVLTPEGRISRYFYGVDFPPKDLRLGLVEASESKIGNAVDAVLLYCYHYNPATGKYGAVVNNMLRLGGAFTIVLLAGMILIFLRLDKAASRRPWEHAKTSHATRM
jgi:protein SCO1